MPEGIRATVAFPASVCPVARAAAAAGATVDSVVRNVVPSPAVDSVTEFSITSDDDPGIDATPVFTHGSTRRYRITHDADDDCPCACLGGFGCAVDRYTLRDDQLTLVFHAADYETLQAVVAELRERFSETDIRRLVRSSPAGRPPDSVFVDRGKLTDRQLETLETAYEMGYFERPRAANATAVAAELGIDPSTFAEHLAAAQSKLFGDLLDADK